ncbi:hypothetical protein Pmani_039985 [Petrolisthes manimaculis]|uniref:Uncharacterized protein n=1 Tax=Petrolisthes manimaculis TaxID=1843537 RepID=A0AAE1ND07_9EUCA|nr:hypothetical protein Pmani_039985 [Petrolisthes manimaculis]
MDGRDGVIIVVGGSGSDDIGGGDDGDGGRAVMEVMVLREGCGGGDDGDGGRAVMEVMVLREGCGGGDGGDGDGSRGAQPSCPTQLPFPAALSCPPALPYHPAALISFPRALPCPTPTQNTLMKEVPAGGHGQQTLGGMGSRHSGAWAADTRRQGVAVTR